MCTLTDTENLVDDRCVSPNLLPEPPASLLEAYWLLIFVGMSKKPGGQGRMIAAEQMHPGAESKGGQAKRALLPQLSGSQPS